MRTARRGAHFVPEPEQGTLPQLPWTLLWAILVLAYIQVDVLAQTIPNVRFLALEEVERQEKLGRVRQGLSSEQNSHEERVRDLSQISLQMRNVSDIPNDDQRILACMQLRLRIREVSEKIEADRANRLGIADTIRIAAKEKDADEKVLAFLRQATALNQKLIRGADAHEATLKKQFKWVTDYIKRVPPPRAYTSSAGIRMVLVASGKSSFYISSGPIPERIFNTVSQNTDVAEAPEEESPPKTDLTRAEAATFCRRLSVFEGRLYVLPSRAQVEDLATKGIHPRIASWTADTWEWKDAEEHRMTLRFGVMMASIWNSTKRLGPDDLVPELPFAHYNDLGFFVVTDRETGIIARAKRLKAYLK